MNQILYTDNNKNDNKVNIKKVVAIFAIAIIVLSSCILFVSFYKIYNNMQSKKKLSKPQIIVTRNSNEQISLNISCEDGINYVIYKWNDTEDNRINLNGSTVFEKIVDIPYNKNNILKVEAESINKTKAETTQEFETEIDEEKPIIESILTNGSTLTIKASDQSGVDYIEYQWEEGEKIRVEADIDNNKLMETNIDIERGTHKLTISVADIYGNEDKISRLVTGVNEPEIKVIKYDNVINIKITHDMGIKQVNALINDELYTYDENSTDYSDEKTIELEYPLKEGENIIKIVAYSFEKLSEDEDENLNNLSYKTYVGKCTYVVGE